jgi:hypothetical protein
MAKRGTLVKLKSLSFPVHVLFQCTGPLNIAQKHSSSIFSRARSRWVGCLLEHQFTEVVIPSRSSSRSNTPLTAALNMYYTLERSTCMLVYTHIPHTAAKKKAFCALEDHPNPNPMIKESMTSSSAALFGVHIVGGHICTQGAVYKSISCFLMRDFGGKKQQCRHKRNLSDPSRFSASIQESTSLTSPSHLPYDISHHKNERATRIEERDLDIERTWTLLDPEETSRRQVQIEIVMLKVTRIPSAGEHPG